MSVSILPYLAKTDHYCRRCLAIGIPSPTIMAGDHAYNFVTDGREASCCGDCFDRLREESEADPFPTWITFRPDA